MIIPNLKAVKIKINCYKKWLFHKRWVINCIAGRDGKFWKGTEEAINRCENNSITASSSPAERTVCRITNYLASCPFVCPFVSLFVSVCACFCLCVRLYGCFCVFVFVYTLKVSSNWLNIRFYIINIKSSILFWDLQSITFKHIALYSKSNSIQNIARKVF